MAGRTSTGRARWQFTAKRALWRLATLAGFPVRYLFRRRLAAFSRRSLVDKGLAEHWRRHYLRGLAVPPGAVMFEYSYRTVEKVGFAALLGFRIAVQDIRQPSWWRDEPHAWLQVVPLDGRYLPYTEGFADLAFTDGAIFDFERDALQAFFLECLRVLKPGGFFIIWAGNSRSRSRARSETRWHGRIHSLPEVRTAAIDAGFLEVDCSFEGFSPPFFATVVNMLRLALGPWPIKTYDYDSWLAQWQRPERRAYWLLRLEKPALHASRSAV